MKEYYYDKLFNIHTNGKGVFNSNSHYHPYEPTPYQALELLFEQYEVRTTDQFVDFGCGLGRLNFFIHYHFHASVMGIEMSEIFYRKALQNRDHYAKKMKHPSQKIEFECSRAEDYNIKPGDNRFYFFNPFSVHIFQHIVNRVLQSVEDFPREVDILLYYPSDDYIFYLENQTMFQLVQEVDLPYEKNPNERFLIYRLKY
ncbi:class I SAM-dependent methyltransferase [Ornithinibacillus californiensis]|uniref:class I SAM-dependent methyltransferase n=1 Tax=Ornithinibacillus californiensis TaxID=161536 RepID=UPI00064D9ED8|nr:methyltransferase [Ornithinibacillus californiensis]